MMLPQVSDQRGESIRQGARSSGHRDAQSLPNALRFVDSFHPTLRCFQPSASGLAAREEATLALSSFPWSSGLQ